jgi:hypothetical protein
MLIMDSWTIYNVASWLESIDMGQKADSFKEVDGKQLVEVSSDDLKALGLTNLIYK